MIPTRILAAALLVAAGPVAAETHGDSPAIDEAPQYGDTYRATTLIGTEIHITPNEMPTEEPISPDMVDGWEEVGEIGDLLIGVDGTLEAAVVDVGGFLGMGEKEVSIEWSGLRPVRQPGDMDDWFLGLSMTRAELEAAPEMERERAD
ncbi:PRC-barrel domain protein [Jannaschia seosinensis]|uniref:PRC-barrel domain protein n=1 Tax=Jannaschia seosinensis TaxID=313367 RepID=A0A0M7BD98_9RHOB|nr:PRC-barrel domain-containing protein [Jannaschia seosinensis]CUH40710.1 PRC-barrel domain protein [Jannaschia seosinensis]